MEQWEYKYVHITRTGDGKAWWDGQERSDLTSLLNKYGLAGWELVNANQPVSESMGDNLVTCFFKRRKA
ncbi:MAG TPA: DUF4177 domain-containing protein [Ktedonobacterales bacterium]|jgi:hypothetical protein|nr:DUF4177 domain-containing protein [Ktedonobacterales bacterium]